MCVKDSTVQGFGALTKCINLNQGFRAIFILTPGLDQNDPGRVSVQ